MKNMDSGGYEEEIKMMENMGDMRHEIMEDMEDGVHRNYGEWRI